VISGLVDVKIVDSANPLIPIFIDLNDTSNNSTSVEVCPRQTGSATAGNSSMAELYQHNEDKSRGTGTTPDSTITVRPRRKGKMTGGVFSALPTPGEYRYQFSLLNTVTLSPPAPAGPRCQMDRDPSHCHQFPDNVESDKSFADFVRTAFLGAPLPSAAVNRKIATNTAQSVSRETGPTRQGQIRWVLRPATTRHHGCQQQQHRGL
jgi:hypothetical protein